MAGVTIGRGSEAEYARQGQRPVARRPQRQPADLAIEPLARRRREHLPDLGALEAVADEAGEHLDLIGEPQQLDLRAPRPLRSQRVVVGAGVGDEPAPLLRVTGLAEQSLCQVAALVRVDASVRDRRVDADVVDERRAQRHLAVEVQTAPRGQPLDQQEAAQPVSLHDAVGLAGDLSQLVEEALLERRFDQVRGNHLGHSQLPRSASASASQTRSTWPFVIEGKNGSASNLAEASSATGNWPARYPNRSRTRSIRWMHGMYAFASTSRWARSPTTASRSAPLGRRTA